eukprot:CAMPEP_0185750266 /NCGR_PEP_ID=MMETSP1174-20130828/9036_1 /TAXON_ID=35687 /ORGANISM="Dictyocha speculum, Strain CCMP1381" /LENGTH=57 /DNA_ID=CAMNT_0028426753 /DNA_START=35 /DNA_END=208 /DNA_ORIENTATION=-
MPTKCVTPWKDLYGLGVFQVKGLSSKEASREGTSKKMKSAPSIIVPSQLTGIEITVV